MAHSLLEKYPHFQIDIVPTTKQIDQLKMWLATNKPSQIHRSSGVGWISVQMKEAKEEEDEEDGPCRNMKAKEDWDSVQGEKTMNIINDIAAKYGITHGKWLCHVPRDTVDKYFSKLSLALSSGGLGPAVSMKVHE